MMSVMRENIPMVCLLLASRVSPDKSFALPLVIQEPCQSLYPVVFIDFYSSLRAALSAFRTY
jgi:hypothetical protein